MIHSTQIDTNSNSQITVDDQMSTLQKYIVTAATRVFGTKKIVKTQGPPVKRWFDEELKSAQASLRRAWSNSSPAHARKLQKKYRNLIKRKKHAYASLASARLCALAKVCPAAFWRAFARRKPSQNPLPATTWQQAFQSLLGTPAQLLTSSVHPSPMPVPHAVLDASEMNLDISESEVEQALKKLKRHKAAGYDEIKAEYLLDAADLFIPILAPLFTKMLRTGFPRCLSTGVIYPIFKSGDPCDPANYRGITVGPVLAKLFATVLDARLTQWTEDNNVRARGQAGFRQGYRTTDNMLILRCIMEKYRSKHVFCCFVDFKKAFDTVSRQKLWDVLQNLGLHGDFLKCLQDMYSQDFARVFCGAEGLSDAFACCIGVKQGCPMSPNLFGLFIDNIETRLLACSTFAPELNVASVPLLLFADDLALLSLSHAGLQKQMDLLDTFCVEHGLTVNVKKTQFLVFHMRMSTPVPDLMFANAPIQRVEFFRYLGMHFHATKGFSFASDQLLQSAKKATHALYRRCIELHIANPSLQCKLFDALVVPVLSYACEIWAVDSPNGSNCPQEQLHTSFIKRLLGLSSCAPDVNARGELGRYPVKIAWMKLLIKFWNRLCTLPQDRLLHHAFVQLHSQFLNTSHPSWLSKFACLLEQEFGPRSDYLQCLHQGIPIEEWRVAITQCKGNYLMLARAHPSIVASTYWSMKPRTIYACEEYLTVVRNRHHRRSLTMFRTGSHWLQIQQGRFQNIPREQRLCKLCNNGEVEDEDHMLFSCSAHATSRQRHAALFEPFAAATARKCTWRFMKLNKDKMVLVAKYVDECRLRSLVV